MLLEPIALGRNASIGGSPSLVLAASALPPTPLLPQAGKALPVSRCLSCLVIALMYGLFRWSGHERLLYTVSLFATFSCTHVTLTIGRHRTPSTAPPPPRNGARPTHSAEKQS